MGKGDPEGGRPRVEIDLAILEGMVTIQCTAEECASVLGVSVDTIDNRLREATGSGFSEFHKKHSDTGRRSLRRAQFALALGAPAKDGTPAVPGHPTMLIWLGKQYLGQKDRQDIVVQDTKGETPVFKVIIPGLGKGNGRDESA